MLGSEGASWSRTAQEGGEPANVFILVMLMMIFLIPTQRKSIRPTLEMFFSDFFFEQRHEERAAQTFGPTIFQRLPSFDEKAMDPRISIYGHALWLLEKKKGSPQSLSQMSGRLARLRAQPKIHRKQTAQGWGVLRAARRPGEKRRKNK
jgi:hypothetical protein